MLTGPSTGFRAIPVIIQGRVGQRDRVGKHPFWVNEYRGTLICLYISVCAGEIGLPLKTTITIAPNRRLTYTRCSAVPADPGSSHVATCSIFYHLVTDAAFHLILPLWQILEWMPEMTTHTDYSLRFPYM